ncbi:helix-turn-helix transcriptional regulator [Acinetobacter baumannii]|uniref:helix-turn-helix transcriptional regulator n=1 Tax=Acinetobacter baumannii TaxID=470 RepID=UPI000BF6D309|nr:helix-turn-helix transcriptional regulator [Acinetobacter baumannii]
MKHIEITNLANNLNLYNSNNPAIQLGPLHITRMQYPASHASKIEINAPTLAFVLGNNQANVETQISTSQQLNFTGQFGLIHFVPKGTFNASSWNSTIDVMTITFESDTIEVCDTHLSLASIQQSILYFDPLACTIAADISLSLNENNQTALDYLLHRVITKVKKQEEHSTRIIQQVEKIALDIRHNLPDLYIDGKFIYDSVLDDHELRQAFIERFGCTPHTFALQAKIDSAKIMLCETSFSLADIANILGFSDQSHFARVFKSHTAMTPKSYRLNSTNFLS